MSNATAAPAPLDEVMLAMDVVDTLRHRQDLALRELDAAAREAQLLARLKDIYHQQGIEVPEHVLREGVAALAESRFVYTPPTPSLQLTLAKLYVSRGAWGRWAMAMAMALLLALGGYFLAYRPWQAAQLEQSRVELAEALPARMDALFQTIFEETKVEKAVEEAEALRMRGKTAAAEGDRAGAQAAVEGLVAIRDTLRREYTLRVINTPNERSGFWTFPEINTEATNYYLIVEAVTPDGTTLSLPVLNEENNQVETVSRWGVRVPEGVYRAAEADKTDDGIIQRNVVGLKQYGFLEVDYVVPVSGGSLTRW